MNNQNKTSRYTINFDFASLYPTSMKLFILPEERVIKIRKILNEFRNSN